jgi:hypothetical protein
MTLPRHRLQPRGWTAVVAALLVVAAHVGLLGVALQRHWPKALAAGTGVLLVHSFGGIISKLIPGSFKNSPRSASEQK